MRIGGSDAANDCSAVATPCATIARAVSQAATGDVIKVARGRYRENLVIDFPIDLTILGGWTSTFDARDPAPGKTTVVAGKPAGVKDRVMAIVAGAGETITVAIDGLTLKGGQASSPLRLDLLYSTAGGLAVLADGGTVGLTVNRARITGNRGQANVPRAGGVSLHALSGSVTSAFTDVEISANRAYDAVAVRTAHTADSGDPTSGVVDFSCTQCLLVKNKATKSHSGLRLGNTVLASGGTLSLVNSTITQNLVGADSGPIGPTTTVSVSDASGTFRNTIIHGNTPRVFGDDGVTFVSSTVDVDHSDIAAIDGSFNDLGGNLSAPPGLTRKARIAAGSPLIDAGTCAGAPATDFDGDPRPTGAGCDIGVDEFVPAS